MTTLGEALPDVTSMDTDFESRNVRLLPDAVLRIPVSVQVVVGTARLSLSDIAKLTLGTTLPLEEKLTAPARILVNGREVARGELVVMDETDGRLGISITDVSGTSSDS